jgi:bacillithiol biosynthesis deacetylase BshB1
MKLDVLAIGAHPDDIELSCAATLVKLVKQGRSVGIVDLTRGELGTRGSGTLRVQEAEASARILGVHIRENLSLPDGNISIDQENILKMVITIRKYKPEILLFPYSSDRHPDHEHAHDLCKDAFFFSGLVKIETTLDGQAQESYRPKRYYHYMQWNEFIPSFIVDVSEEFECRMQAIRAFASQFHNPQSKEKETVLSNPEFIDFIRTRAEYYGDRIGAKFGEPFASPAVPGIRNLFDIF